MDKMCSTKVKTNLSTISAATENQLQEPTHRLFSKILLRILFNYKMLLLLKHILPCAYP